MRVAMYGGSFNPPHLGHALVAAWLRWTDQVDEVWLVPVGGHAFGKVLVPFERRLLWCEALASTVGPGVRACDIERELPSPNYSLHTLVALAERHPEHQFRLVVGADTLPQTPRWHRWDEIERSFPPIVVGRAGYESPPNVPVFPGVSSTDIRARLVAGRSATALVPQAVLRQISADDIAQWGNG